MSVQLNKAIIYLDINEKHSNRIIHHHLKLLKSKEGLFNNTMLITYKQINQIVGSQGLLGALEVVFEAQFDNAAEKLIDYLKRYDLYGEIYACRFEKYLKDCVTHKIIKKNFYTKWWKFYNNAKTQIQNNRFFLTFNKALSKELGKTIYKLPDNVLNQPLDKQLLKYVPSKAPPRSSWRKLLDGCPVLYIIKIDEGYYKFGISKDFYTYRYDAHDDKYGPFKVKYAQYTGYLDRSGLEIALKKEILNQEWYISSSRAKKKYKVSGIELFELSDDSQELFLIGVMKYYVEKYKRDVIRKFNMYS